MIPSTYGPYDPPLRWSTKLQYDHPQVQPRIETNWAANFFGNPLYINIANYWHLHHWFPDDFCRSIKTTHHFHKQLRTGKVLYQSCWKKIDGSLGKNFGLSPDLLHNEKPQVVVAEVWVPFSGGMMCLRLWWWLMNAWIYDVCCWKLVEEPLAQCIFGWDDVYIMCPSQIKHLLWIPLKGQFKMNHQILPSISICIKCNISPIW